MQNNYDSNQGQPETDKEVVSPEEEIRVDSEQNSEQQSEDPIQECQAELARWKNQYMHVMADFENFKKRLDKERAQTSRRIKESVLLDLLPIVDNFERALSVNEQPEDAKAVLQGFEMIHKELCKMLTKHVVEEIVEDKVFNPELHEAVMSVASDEHSSGDIVAVLQKGYTIDGAVLRPVKVSVAE